jgi:hypothetical protein
MLGDCSNDKVYEHIAKGELESFLEGRVRYVTVRSIEALIERRLAAPRSFQRSPNPRCKTA